MKIFLFSFILFGFLINPTEPLPKKPDVGNTIMCSGKLISASDNLNKGKCYGYANCTACTTCSSCAYCNSGGSCGVCSYVSPSPKYRTKKYSTSQKQSQKKSSSPPINHVYSTPKTKNTKPSSVSKNYTIIGNSVNIRSKPSIYGSEVLFQLNKNDFCEISTKSTQKVVIKGYDEDYWYKINYQGKEGWVFGGLIKKATSSQELETSNRLKTCKIIGENVNIRNRPSVLNSKVKFQLSNNAVCTIISKSSQKYFVKGYKEDYWYKIKYQGKEGWVFGGLIKTHEKL